VTTATSLTARVLDTIRRRGWLHGGEVVLVAVSGGADSVALLDVLFSLRDALRLSIEVAHVHHGLRAEADADAEFVRRLAASLGAPFHLERVAVRREPPWEGLEAEARRARHAALLARAAAVGAHRVAMGHTADDQAETVLMRLLEGAGPRGLAGIAPGRGLVIRPLLEVRRRDIAAHLASRELGWVEDASNRDTRFLRSRLRHDVIPFLEGAFGPHVVASLCRSAAASRALVDDLERLASSELGRVAATGPAGVVLPIDALSSRSEELAVQILIEAAARLGETRPRRAATQRALRRLLGERPPRRAVRVGDLAVERSGRWLRVGPVLLPALLPRRVDVPGCADLSEVGLRLTARCFERSADYAIPRDARRAAFDADRVPPALAVRGRRAGDRMAPFGGPGERRLKSLLIDAGIPRWERARVPLVEAAGDILWVAGVRRGRAAIVGPETRRILELTLDSL